MTFKRLTRTEVSSAVLFIDMGFFLGVMLASSIVGLIAFVAANVVVNVVFWVTRPKDPGDDSAPTGRTGPNAPAGRSR